MSDKTEPPTPRKLAKAREKGDVAASPFASQALGFLLAALLAPAAVSAAGSHASAMIRRALRGPPPTFEPMDLARDVLGLVMPLLVAVAATSALVTVVQTGALFAPKRVAPDLGRLNLFAGLKNLFRPDRLWTVGRALIASVAVGYLAVSILRDRAGDLSRAVGSTAASLAVAGDSTRRLLRDAAAVGIAMAIFNLVVTRRSFLSKLKMSKADVKREHRESEGDPQLKAARHRAHHEMLAAATVNAVRDATVVIVNPEHLATALRYVDGEDEAPKVLANGDGNLAQRIQEAARAYGIPIVRDVPVARALAELEVGDTIPEALYEAVAEILREVWSSEEGAEGGASTT